MPSLDPEETAYYRWLIDGLLASARREGVSTSTRGEVVDTVDDLLDELMTRVADVSDAVSRERRSRAITTRHVGSRTK
jgi:hypothetical protein